MGYQSIDGVEVVDVASEMTLLPPRPGVCQQCANENHTDPNQPHDQQSLYWQYWFYGQHERWPTWKDAMAHCSDDVKASWVLSLRKYGVFVEEEHKEVKNDE